MSIEQKFIKSWLDSKTKQKMEGKWHISFNVTVSLFDLSVKRSQLNEIIFVSSKSPHEQKKKRAKEPSVNQEPEKFFFLFLCYHYYFTDFIGSIKTLKVFFYVLLCCVEGSSIKFMCTLAHSLCFYYIQIYVNNIIIITVFIYSVFYSRVILVKYILNYYLDTLRVQYVREGSSGTVYRVHSF